VYDINLNFPYWSGAVVMLVGFALSLLLLSRKPHTLEMGAAD
jgi:hypothetical protein